MNDNIQYNSLKRILNPKKIYKRNHEISDSFNQANYYNECIVILKDNEIYNIINNDLIKNIVFNEEKIPIDFDIGKSIRFHIVNYCDIIKAINYLDFCSRYDNSRRYNMIKEEEEEEEEFQYEKIDDESISYSDDDIFNISSWGVDLTFRELVNMYDDNDLIKPELQRNYVWSFEEACKFIDSILLGLPIPSIFLAKKGDQRLIVDGYQRIMTVYDYISGVFSGNNKVFKLSDSTTINERWRGKAFVELDENYRRRLKNTTIHAIIFEQKKPDNDAGMYQIFERINTSGRTLNPQEIRNCIYHGNFNSLLIKLNTNKDWRILINSENPDRRMMDMENILRLFAMRDIKNSKEFKSNQIILKKYLNDYMSRKANISSVEMQVFEAEFNNLMKFIIIKIGHNAFNNVSHKNDIEGNKTLDDVYIEKFHPTIFEAVAISSLYILENNIDISDVKNMKKRHVQLLNDYNFREAISIRTTRIENIKKRIELAAKHLFDVDYEWR